MIYFLGVEWSLVYEVFLSVALAGLGLIGPRRGVPILVGVWLAAIAAKVAAFPGYASDPFPHWSRIALSAYNVPFLLGVLVYQVKDRGRWWRWGVLPGVVGLLVFGPEYATRPETQWCMWGAAAAGVVWLAVQFRQVSERHTLARLGDYTYGLFLVHVPLVCVGFHAAVRAGWTERVEVVVFVGVVAVVGGLLFGRLECAIHSRLRPLAKIELAGVMGRPEWLRVRGWIGRMTGR